MEPRGTKPLASVRSCSSDEESDEAKVGPRATLMEGARCRADDEGAGTATTKWKWARRRDVSGDRGVLLAARVDDEGAELRRRYGNGHGAEEMSLEIVARWHRAWVMGRRHLDEEMKMGTA